MRGVKLPRLTGADCAFGIGLIVLAGGAAWRWHRPLAAELSSLTESVARQKQERSALDRLEAAIRESADTTESLEARLASYEHTALISASGNEYLDVISRSQDRCGLTVTQLSPGLLRAEGAYPVRSVEIAAAGDFGSVLCFLEALDASFAGGRMAALRIHAEPDRSHCELSIRMDLYATAAGEVLTAPDRTREPGA